MRPNLLDFIDWVQTEEADISNPDSFKEWYNHYEDEEEPAEKEDSPIVEKVIYKFFEQCLEENRLPSLQEAQSVHILDEILDKYNK
jgi:hypothetical protein